MTKTQRKALKEVQDTLHEMQETLAIQVMDGLVFGREPNPAVVHVFHEAWKAWEKMAKVLRVQT